YNGLLYEEGRYNYGIRARFRAVGSKELTCEDWMVNTRTDADLSTAVQNALQTLLPQIRAEIREEFRTSSGPSDSGGNPPPVTIHTWLERFNKQKPRSFEKETAPDAFKTRLAVYKFEGNALAWWKAYKQAKGGDAWLIIVTWAEFKKLFFLQLFPRAEQERLKREYHSIHQTNTETSTKFMQLAGTKEEQAKNFQWGLRRSTLNHLMSMPFTDVAQVANAARNYEILHERDDDDAERPDKRKKSGDRHQPTSQQSSHRNHGHNNDRHGSDRRGGEKKGSAVQPICQFWSSGNGHDQRNKGQQSNRPVNSGFQQSRGPSEGYSYPVCTRCGRRHPGECRRDAGTCFKCGQTGHLEKDCKKNNAASTSGQADKKPGASGHVFAITEDHATKTSEHHATIDCRSYRVIFGDIHAPEFIYHGFLLGKSMQIISALQARTLLSHGYEGYVTRPLLSLDILLPSIKFPYTVKHVYLRVMSSFIHPTSNIEDAFSSLNYTSASPAYSPASPGNTPSESLNNSYGLVPIASPTLSLFHDDPYMKVMQAYDAIITPQVPIPPLIIMPLSLMLSPIFNPQEFFVSEELLPPKEQVSYLTYSSTDLSNPSQKQAAQAANMKNTDNTYRNPEQAPVARKCSYKEFMSCQPFNFKGSEGAVGLIRWFKCTKSVFSHSNCIEDCKVKFAVRTLTEEALSW
nr:hypothetical protein [Tanacetum cinerariifolium]